MPKRVNIDKHTNMLIIGAANNNNNLKQIVYADKEKEVNKTFGETSDLAKAYQVAKFFGVQNVFLMNVRKNYDYLEICNVLKQTDFAYIVPVSILLSDVFDEPKTERRISYIEYMMEQIGHSNESVFIVTDKRAELFEDIDAYIEDMNSVTEDFYDKMDLTLVNPENIVCVSNNLQYYPMSNIPLAAALCVTQPWIYPEVNFGPTLFELDAYENIGTWAYYMDHTVRSTTVENLLNFKHICPEKLVFISRIIKRIKREFDFSEFPGKQYSEYRRMLVEDKLRGYLEKMSKTILYQYNILSVLPWRNKEPMTIDIENVFEVWPVNCLDKVTIKNTVEVA